MVFWSSLRRLIHIVFVILRHALAHKGGNRLVAYPVLARCLPPLSLSGPDRLRAVIEDVGGTFIKLGQMLALQPDILPLEYCSALFDLLDRVSPFGFDEVEKTFVEDFGKKPSEIFDHFETRPLATASIGQVHVAYLGWRKLAVKIQRPNVQRDFAGDIRLMTTTINLIKRLRLKRLFWMLEPVGEFVSWTREELDYRREARYMDAMRNNAHRNPFERVPEVLWEYTGRRILVAEFLDGVTMLDYLRAMEAGDELMFYRLKTFGFDPNQFASNIIDNFLNDACRHGIFHADLHPANLMILPDNVVGYIDFGITGFLSRYSSHNLVNLTLAFTRADLDGLHRSFVKSSVLGANADVDAFRERLTTLSDDWYEAEGKKRRLSKSFTLVMLDMLGLSRKTDIWPERDVIKYIRSAIAIDGLISRFAPSFNLSRYLEMVCDRYLRWQARRSLLSYDTLVGWSSASARLARDGAFRMAGVLDRLASGELPLRVGLSGGTPERGRPTQRRAIQLALVFFVVSLLIGASGEPVRLGLNLFTAEATLVGAVAMMLLRASRGFA